MIFAKALLITAPFWQAALKRLNNPAAIRMAESLDPGGPLGIGNLDNPFWKGFKHTGGQKDSNIDFLLRIKKKHPEKIVIVQVGEFYETWALDSVFLVEYCGLNRMGRGGPRAGTPLVNLQSVLDRLTAVGFSVVVCEQAEDSQPNGRKTRFIAEIVTPSSPIYTYGLAMDKRRANTTFPDCPPEFGIVCDKRGITIVEINPDLRIVLTLEALTQEAARMRLLRYGGRLSRVFYHENVEKNFLAACELRYEHLVRVSGYLPREFPRRVTELLKIELAMPAETVFTQVQNIRSKQEINPRPLYLGTAEQIGLLPAPGIPSLIKQLLPASSPLICQNLLRLLLLNPPPPSVAQKIRTALKTILNQEIIFPEFPVANPARYLKTLQRGEASPEILRDLYQIAHCFLACRKTAFAQVLPSTLAVVSHLTNLTVAAPVLAEKSKAILNLLKPILPAKEDPPHQPQSELLSKHLFALLEESFRGRVAPTATAEIAEHYTRVQQAAQAYEQALNQKLLPLVALKEKAKTKPLTLSFDLHNQSIWLRGPVRQSQQNTFKLIHPRDRYNKEVHDRWTTEQVEVALAKYKSTIEAARLSVANLLKKLSVQLSAHNLPIVQLTTFSNLLRTLILHAREGQTKKWGLKVEQKAQSEQRLVLKNFFPYWLTAHTAVTNSLQISSMALLTGHNMAGKSTLLRSAAVTSLLASTGLLFPATAVALPEPIDSWFVRTGTHDDPESGLSAFAVEIKDLKTALRDASASSVLFIDELGKGTESHAGHALAGSVLEHCQQQKIRGIFATHWHELFLNPVIKLTEIQQIQMEVQKGQPTYKVLAGACLTSWAFETACQLGFDFKLIERAKIIAAGYPKHTVKQVRPYTASAKNQQVSYLTSNKFTLSTARTMLSDVTGIPSVAIRTLTPNARPWIKDLNQSALYVLNTPRDFFYVGETNDLQSRLAFHRKDPLKKNSYVLYVLIKQGKNVAQKMETQLIKAFQAAGVPLLSTGDGERRHFGM